MTTLDESHVHVWYRNTAQLDAAAVKSADVHLSLEERARRDRFRFAADRRDFTAAHDLLRRALSQSKHMPPADWQFATNDYGKPSIASSDPRARALSFSLSHTRGWIACAVTVNAPVGVDVERTDRSLRVDDLAARCFSDEEAVWLRQCSAELRSVRFTELWTLKEAFLKALGVGLSGSLASVSLGFDGHAHIDVTGPSIVEPREWHFALFEPGGDARLAVAVRCAARPHFFVRDDDDGRTLTPIREST